MVCVSLLDGVFPTLIFIQLIIFYFIFITFYLAVVPHSMCAAHTCNISVYDTEITVDDEPSHHQLCTSYLFCRYRVAVIDLFRVM